MIPVVVALVLVAGCGSSGPAAGGSDPNALPSPSAVGKPTGASVSKAIGSAGGSLSAGDSRLTVTIPAGALANDVTIAIEPIENTAAGGLGAGYRLTPAGQVFTQPVRVSFAYTDDDLEGAGPEALGIAFQDGAGRWEWQQQVALDPAAKQLSVMMTHFTDYSLFRGWQLRPLLARVKLAEHVRFVLNVCVFPPSLAGIAYLLKECVSAAKLPGFAAVIPKTWAVNGKSGGSDAVGTVAGDDVAGDYVAPRRKPAAVGGKAAVFKVSADADIKGMKGKAHLVAYVAVLGGYHAVGTASELNAKFVCPGAVSPEMKDKVEFSFAPTEGGGFTVSNIENSATSVEQPMVPVLNIPATVVTPPDILEAKRVTVETSGPDLILVAVAGDFTIGVCRSKDPETGAVLVLGEADTGHSGTRFAFHPANFVNGVQTAVSSDEDIPGELIAIHWTWTVTEEP